ncbi:MAG TPA: cell division protein ZapA [Spirochaetota bacterium]|jgi:cell division protein ZapA (FtsZ GTPase activity inhibitor)|nr:MAG: Cell division protein ZapA [Spirochaetes bacterium ADurb.Bin133]HNZ26811.1 cell division protein ZapA [Spirochaetota bacterium]HPY87488.1 cell division protein ZapA [Spirochaetota bacterium]HQB60699.1 cell division protein ZapA [Spirochaetota bacterium]
MNGDKYNLELFGQNFSLVTKDGKKDELIKVGNYFKSIVESIQKRAPNKSQLDIAVLAGLTVTDELYNLAKSKKTTMNGDNQKIDEIITQAIKQLEVSLKL